MKNIVLGVTGSSAIHKSIELIDILKADGFNVSVVMSNSAKEFVTPKFFDAVSNGLKQKESNVHHVELGQLADVFLIAPATANIIAELAHGLAGNEVSTTALLMEDKPKFIAPAMNTKMYNNKMVQKNLEILKSCGYRVIEPREGRLSNGEMGIGVLADIADIAQIVKESIDN